MISWKLLAGQQNFGAISIDWDANPATVRLEIRDVNGLTALSTNVSLSELQPRGSKSLTDPTTKGKSQRHCTLEAELQGITRYRLAVLVYFIITGMLLFPITNVSRLVRTGSKNVEEYWCFLFYVGDSLGNGVSWTAHWSCADHNSMRL